MEGMNIFHDLRCSANIAMQLCALFSKAISSRLSEEIICTFFDIDDFLIIPKCIFFDVNNLPIS